MNIKRKYWVVTIYSIYFLIVLLGVLWLYRNGFFRCRKIEVLTLRGYPRVIAVQAPRKTRGKHPPNLWQRPETMTFNITPKTEIVFLNEGARIFEGEKTIEPARRDDLIPGRLVNVIIDNWWNLKAETIQVERATGVHAGEEIDATWGPSGWISEGTFSGRIVRVSDLSITVRRAW